MTELEPAIGWLLWIAWRKLDHKPDIKTHNHDRHSIPCFCGQGTAYMLWVFGGYIAEIMLALYHEQLQATKWYDSDVTYCKVSNISCTLVDNKMLAPTTSSFST